MRFSPARPDDPTVGTAGAAAGRPPTVVGIPVGDHAANAAWCPPRSEDRKVSFLKTLYPSRKYTKLHRRGKLT